ncbi:3-hydroxyacyl-CoA dehydrogenase [Thalassovita sp.]|uniref:3-hydroxyacyl-CoA dehydrogenase n=1 Tax=Thalassovita sp. TaxID=1979401 RepID=UPI0029DE8E48|nr:3-hydroxyacyl-CoA dehydrogenase family protein [Thalassovita sp.]
MRIPLPSDLSVAEKAANRAHLVRLENPPLPTRPLDRVTVIGGAANGLGVALSLVAAGIPALFLEEDASSLERARFYLKRMTGGSVPPILHFSIDPRDATASDLVIDQTIEPEAQKATLLRRVAEALPSGTPLLTNLAGPCLSNLAKRVPDPTRLLGAEFFAAAQSRLLELAPLPGTGAAALRTASTLAGRLEKTTVIASAKGFTSERLQMRLLEAADTLLMDGSTPWEVDEAIEEFGYHMGPYEAQDLIGTDVAYAIRSRMPRDPARRYIPIADRAVAEGRLGKKASVGWYRYPGGEGKVIDPLVEDLCREEARFAGVAPRPIPADDIRTRILLAQVNEAAAALGDGIPPGDLDLISTHALGFPARWGGIIRFADRLGAPAILAALHALQGEDPVAWQPASALVHAARSGERLGP